ncbi:MAG: hypothetical protein HYU66_15205, partial [Armatimonadetes bacterium]|nr:hypothetical protein [Armatimonadota bacterium]
WQYWKLYGDLEPFRQTAERLERAMAFTPRNPANGLVAIPDAALFRPYSFMDTVPLVGDEQFSSVLYLDAANKLGELYTAAGEAERAARWRGEAERVRAGLRSLWDEKVGMFVAASVNWRQPSVWGSVFAVYAGAATPEQTERIRRWCLANYDQIVHRGQVRHLPKGTYWGRPEPEYVSDEAAARARLAAGYVFTLGQDDPAGFPALQPGAVPPVKVRFHLERVPAAAKLLVGLRWDEAYRDQPLGLGVELNGRAGEVAIPNAGRPELQAEWPAAVAFEVPAGALRVGENELTLAVRGEGWWRYDGIALAGGG